MNTFQEMREHYQTHDMRFDGVVEYGFLDDYVVRFENTPKCRVCGTSVITIVDRGAICRECRLTGGYNSPRGGLK